jgi:3-oxoadipate enol-lactonase / 4-carboxymuconolactone decarboxylase
MPFAKLDDGCRLFYRLEGPGDAPAVIFSNSLGADHMMWQPQAEALSPLMRIVRYDQRGHGASDVPPGPYTLERLGRDVLDLADHLGLTRFSFCGLSMGGLTGQWLGVHAGERLDRLVLADTSAQFPPPSMWDERMAVIHEQGLAGIAEAVLGRFFSPGFHEARPGIVEDFRQVLLNMDSAGYLGCCEAIKPADMRDQIAAIATPTLVISGRHDQSTPPERGEFIAGRIKGSRHEVLDAAHLSNVEQAEAFTALLAGFLGVDKLPADDRFVSGMKRRRAALGDEWVDRANGKRTAFNADFQNLITRYAWGEIWTRPGLSDETRRLLVLAVTASLSRWEEFDLHLAAALRAGVTPDTIKEVLMQTAIYAGVPAANTGFARASAIMAKVD